MRSVVICGSRRFKEEIRAFAEKLKKAGVTVYEPILNTDRKIDKLPDNLKYFSFLGLTHHHFSQIRKADVVFFYNQGSYLGASSTMELGFCEALGKPIYFLEEDKDDPCRNVLYDEIIKTPKDLLKRLK